MAVTAGRRVGKLTARYVETVKTPGLFGDGGGLYLKVGDGGQKSWIVRWSSSGSVHKLGLGATHTVGLSDARQRAAEVRRLILDGIDPREARRAAAVSAARTISFDAACERYIASHRAGWKNAKHATQWQSTLATYASPVFGKLPVSAIDVGLVMRVLQPIWTSKNATAFRLRGRIEAVLSWAKVHGYRGGENPAAWRGNLDHLLPPPGKVRQIRHHAALPYGELPEFMAELRARPGVAARALEFLVLTASRTSEVLGARWDEFDLDNRLWIIPARRMKSGREHRVPLCDRAVAIVTAMQTTDLVFRRKAPLGGMALLRLLRRMGCTSMTHGFRSSFADWAAEETTFPTHVIEAALAHAIADRVAAAYRRGDLFAKRAQLMAAWEQFCATPAGAKVVPLRGGR